MEPKIAAATAHEHNSILPFSFPLSTSQNHPDKNKWKPHIRKIPEIRCQVQRIHGFATWPI